MSPLLFLTWCVFITGPLGQFNESAQLCKASLSFRPSLVTSRSCSRRGVFVFKCACCRCSSRFTAVVVRLRWTLWCCHNLVRIRGGVTGVTVFVLWRCRCVLVRVYSLCCWWRFWLATVSVTWRALCCLIGCAQMLVHLVFHGWWRAGRGARERMVASWHMPFHVAIGRIDFKISNWLVASIIINKWTVQGKNGTCHNWIILRN